MRVALIIHSLGTGGAERVTANLANRWAARGWQVSVVTLAPRDEDRYALDPAVERVALDVAGSSRGLFDAVRQNFRRIGAVRRFLRTSQPAVAIAMMSTTGVLLALAAFGLRGLARIGSERIHPPRRPLRRGWTYLRALAYHWLDAIVVLSTESRDWIAAHTMSRLIRVVPNAVIWPVPDQEPQRSPDSVGVRGRRRLLAVGRLERQKGFDMLIDVFARLAPAFRDWELVILGDGPSRDSLLQRIAARSQGGAVVLPGAVGNVGAWYGSADLFVMSSRFEGFPNALAEAMAYGLAAVSMDCDTGPRDIIRHGVDGLLVPDGDEPGLESALRMLMGDAEARARLAGRAGEVRQRYAPERIDMMWDALFHEVAR